jgi:transcriptional regulator with XRE-family HTH domain
LPNIVLANLRDAHGLTQQEVADRLNELALAETSRTDNVTATTVSKWERGVIERPTPARRRRLATLFGVSISALGYDRQRATPTAFSPAPTATTAALLSPSLLDDVRGPLDERVSASQHEWCLVRRELNQHRVELSRIASRWHESSQRIGRTDLLTRPEWLPAAPVELGSVELAWAGDQPPLLITGTEREARATHPLRSPEQRYSRYTHAIRELERPTLFENRVSFRLLDVAWPSAEQGRLTFGLTTYFDAVDVCEAVAHELAAASLTFTPAGAAVVRPAGQRLPFRKRLGDPFALDRRPLLPSIDTITIRLAKSSASFILHRRDAGHVAVAGGMYHVMPAGVFQPSSVSPTACSADFDLWRNMMREYSEEFLGRLEHDGNASTPIDYEHEEPFRSLNQARQEGRLRVYCLGVGLDPLTFWGEILTVAVFDAEVFDEVFSGLVAANNEGTVVTVPGRERAVRGVPFTEERVDQLLEAEPMAPGAAACLALAWRYQDLILDT